MDPNALNELGLATAKEARSPKGQSIKGQYKRKRSARAYLLLVPSITIALSVAGLMGFLSYNSHELAEYSSKQSLDGCAA